MVASGCQVDKLLPRNIQLAIRRSRDLTAVASCTEGLLACMAHFLDVATAEQLPDTLLFSSSERPSYDGAPKDEARPLHRRVLLKR